MFTLGVGDGCSTELIKSAANAGRGAYEFVNDNEDVSSKIISLLKSAISPNITEFSLKHENLSMVTHTIPDPRTMGYILPNKLCEFVIFFNKRLAKEKRTSVTLKYYDGVL